MKKLFSIMFAALVGIVCLAPEHKAEAQVVYTLKCCDGAGYVRCVLGNWTPVGNSCYCYGQGWGWAC